VNITSNWQLLKLDAVPFVQCTFTQHYGTPNIPVSVSTAHGSHLYRKFIQGRQL